MIETQLQPVMLDPAAIVASVGDPEIPFLSIVDLGIIREVQVDGNTVEVTITPTYSGCPAMETIKSDIISALSAAGYVTTVTTIFAPAWTTDDLTERGRQLLEQHGMAAPRPIPAVRCPRCASQNPRIASEFGSTACKALLVCSSCAEPFDLFKELR